MSRAGTASPPETALHWVTAQARAGASDTPLLARINAAITAYMARTGDALDLDAQRQLLRAAREALAAEAPEADIGAAPTPAAPAASAAPADPGDRLLHLAGDMSQSVLQRFDHARAPATAPDQQRADIDRLVREIAAERRLELNTPELTNLIETVQDEMLGFGPLEPLLADDRISDIMVNGTGEIYVERGGTIARAAARFRDKDHIFRIASRMVSQVGRRIDETSPLVDARLADGSRVHVAAPPLAIDGTTITIRKFPADRIGLSELVGYQSLSAQMAEFLDLAARMRLNIIISGGTGSGKTTLLNALSQRIPPEERLVTIEDAAELQLQNAHVVRLETRPPNLEGTGEVTMRTLVRNALRMRPDRIILGEVRGDEVLDLMQAMNTGHDGSMSTLHANTARDALTRLENMVALSGVGLSTEVTRSQMRDAINLVVHVSRMRDGVRRVRTISEIVGINGGVLTMQDLFTFEIDETTSKSRVAGTFTSSGLRPRCRERAAEFGLEGDLDRVLGV